MIINTVIIMWPERNQALLFKKKRKRETQRENRIMKRVDYTKGKKKKHVMRFIYYNTYPSYI